MDIASELGTEYGPATRDAFGQTLRELGSEMPDLVVLDGDVGNSTRTEYFAKESPERFFNIGIAESNLVGIAAGLASSGKQVLAASFACFLMCNAFDQLRMSIAFPAVNVKFAGSHHGINIGQDGPSQMGIEDMALAKALPGFTVICPADANSTKKATRAIFAHEGPIYLRLGRPKFPLLYPEDCDFEIGKANTLKEGRDLTMFACGLMVSHALVAAKRLAKHRVQAAVVDMHTVNPLDNQCIEKAARETGAIVCAEEHLLNGGMGSGIARSVATLCPVPMEFVGLDNSYAASGKPYDLLKKYHLMPDDIVKAAKKVLKRKKA